MLWTSEESLVLSLINEVNRKLGTNMKSFIMVTKKKRKKETCIHSIIMKTD